MLLSGLIFDLDGTLADTLPEIFDCFRDVLLRYTGRRLPDPELFALFGPTPGQIFRAAVPDRWEEARDAYHQAYAAALAAGRFRVPGMEELMGWLEQQSVRAAVVSGGDRWQVEHTLQGLGIAGHFHPVRFGDAGWDKLSNLGYVLDHWSRPAGQVAYVSDSPRDMEHALGLGLAPLGAAWARAAQPDALRAAGALAVFASPAALGSWLEGDS